MATSADIRTRRLLITPFSEKHLTPRYVAWLNDPELMQFSEQRHKTHTPESCRDYWRSFEGTPHYFWALEELEAGHRHLGNLNAYVDPVNRLADVGILIGEKDSHNRGYALEALAAVFDFLFAGLGIRKLTQGTMALNAPMLRVMNKLGMVPDGVRKRHYLCQGQEVDVVHMAVFREQWEGDVGSYWKSVII
jgi:RimJ/RimL family protein N-acetyltransferase